jgi:hypothetical protein
MNLRNISRLFAISSNSYKSRYFVILSSMTKRQLDLSDPVVSLQIDLEQRLDRCEKAENRARELENENQVLIEKIRMLETFENITANAEDESSLATEEEHKMKEKLISLLGQCEAKRVKVLEQERVGEYKIYNQDLIIRCCSI